MTADGSLKNPRSGLYLNSPDSITTTGTALRVWPCNGSAARQSAASPPILHTLQGGAPNCVDTAGDDLDTDRHPVPLHTCHEYGHGAPGGLAEASDQRWLSPRRITACARTGDAWTSTAMRPPRGVPSKLGPATASAVSSGCRSRTGLSPTPRRTCASTLPAIRRRTRASCASGRATDLPNNGSS